MFRGLVGEESFHSLLLPCWLQSSKMFVSEKKHKANKLRVLLYIIFIFQKHCAAHNRLKTQKILKLNIKNIHQIM
jgi:hypothetical protein